MKHNILHIITHDTGRHLECYGEDVKTPNANRLAKKGVRFTNYFCTAPQCSPSRASMFSGLMPHNNGVMGLVHRGFSLKLGVEYLPQILSENGYRTYLFGFQHESRDSVRLGYQKVFQGGCYSCAKIVPLLNNFLLSNPRQPFFMSLGFSETHRKFPEVENTVKHLKVPSFLPDEPEVKKDIAGLNVLVERVDKYLGEILEILEKTGLSKTTLVIFTTDHGIAFPGAKSTLFDPGIGTFLIMRGPGGFGETEKIDALLSNLDLTPTILDYLGIKVPPQIQGKSFLPIIRGDKEKIREEIYAELTYHAAYDPMRGIRTERHKYIRSFEIRPWYFSPNFDDSFSKDLFKKKGYFNRLRPFEFLFDLKKDPLERTNLAHEVAYSEVLERLRKRLIEWMRETCDPLLEGPVPLPEGVTLTPPWSYSPGGRWLDKGER